MPGSTDETTEDFANSAGEGSMSVQGHSRRSALAVLSGIGAAAVMSVPGSAAAQAQPAPRTFVLVHGSWHGGWCWSRVADRLRAGGHMVFAPTLSGLGERSHLPGARIGLP